MEPSDKYLEINLSLDEFLPTFAAIQSISLKFCHSVQICSSLFSTEKSKINTTTSTTLILAGYNFNPVTATCSFLCIFHFCFFLLAGVSLLLRPRVAYGGGVHHALLGEGGLKLRQGSFRLNFRKNFFTKGVD